MSAPADTRPPHRVGTCEYCGLKTIVYAYVLWTCKRCLESDPA